MQAELTHAVYLHVPSGAPTGTANENAPKRRTVKAHPSAQPAAGPGHCPLSTLAQGGELRKETPGALQALAFCAAPPLRGQGHVVLPFHPQPSPLSFSIVT